MTHQFSTTYLPRQRALHYSSANQESWRQYLPHEAETHEARIKRELKNVGMTGWGLLSSESRFLPQLIHTEEHIGGVVSGQRDKDRVMLVATDKRIIFLDKKPLFVTSEELTYDVVSGINYSQAGIFAGITLHTRMGDYHIKTMNPRSAIRFREYIEARCLEHDAKGGYSHDTVD